MTTKDDMFADIGYEIGLSSCCGARVYKDREICSDCCEHCSIEVEVDETKVIYNGHENA